MDSIYMSRCGAILKKNGKFVNRNSGSKFMDAIKQKLHVPDYVYYNSAPTDFEGNYYIYAGENKLYGVWVAVYGNRMDIVDDCNIKQRIIFGKDVLNGEEDDAVIKTKPKNMSDIYAARLCTDLDTDRWYCSFKIGNDDYTIIFGLDITNDEWDWMNQKKSNNSNFMPEEIEEIDLWFAN